MSPRRDSVLGLALTEVNQAQAALAEAMATYVSAWRKLTPQLQALIDAMEVEPSLVCSRCQHPSHEDGCQVMEADGWCPCTYVRYVEDLSGVGLCGADALGGYCILPSGHNRGRLDIPSNHRSDKQPASWEPEPRLDELLKGEIGNAHVHVYERGAKPGGLCLVKGCDLPYGWDGK